VRGVALYVLEIQIFLSSLKSVKKIRKYTPELKEHHKKATLLVFICRKK
jgi:hypothetical protein